MSLRVILAATSHCAILANLRNKMAKAAEPRVCFSGLAIVINDKMSSSGDSKTKASKVSIRREPKSDTFEMHFRLHIDVLELAREFNLNRNISEPVDSLLNRLKANMEKGFGKKLKKTKAKLGISPEKELVKITAELRLKGKPVPKGAICEDIFFKQTDGADLQFILCGVPFRTEINLPYVTKLSLPDFAMVGLPLYPLKFTTKFASSDKCRFSWYLSIDDGKTWTRTQCQGFAYYPSEDDVSKRIKLEVTPSDGRRKGEVSSAVLPHLVQRAPAPSPLPHQKRHVTTKKFTAFPVFRVVSYNILAGTYAETEAANNELFNYCPQEARAWMYRRQFLMDELKGYNADIVCLQEVDSKAFEHDLMLFFKKTYCGVFNKKFSNREGVATLYNKSRYKLLGTHSCFLGVELDSNSWFADLWESVKGNQQLADRIKGLGTVAQATVLSEVAHPERITVVGNTHLYFHPDADHIRLLQGGMYARFLVEVCKIVKTSQSNVQVSLIACGDFNSVPSCGIFSLFTRNVATADLADWKSKPEEEIVGLELRQPYTFASAYGTPPYTNFTQGFADCLDYIFYQKDKLQLVKVVDLPTEAELRANVALPSIVWPSDHLSLVADLKWLNC